MHNRIASFKKYWFMLAVVLASCPISASADYKEAYKDYKMGQAFAGEFANAYAFLLGQTETIKKIEKSYPNSLIKAKNAFNLSFPSILKKMEAVAQLNFGIEETAEFKINGMNAVYEHLNSVVIDQNYIKTFESEIIARADGKIDSPILENILSVQYYPNPVEELYRGYRINYSSKNHPKSKGVNISIDVPISWKGREGKRPNTLKQWTSQHGWGLDIVNIGIDDVGFEPSLDQIKEYSQSKKDLKQIIMRGFDLVEANLSFIENQPYVEIVSEGQFERAGVKTELHVIQPQIFYKDKIITITCMSPPARKALIKPFCTQILNSVVFPDLY